MARFYGTVIGSADNAATRIGSKNSGLTTRASTWEAGAEVNIYVDQTGFDIIEVYATTGSSPSDIKKYLGQIEIDHRGEPILVVPPHASNNVTFRPGGTP